MRLFCRWEKLNNFPFEGSPSFFVPYFFSCADRNSIQKLSHMQIRAPTVNTCTVQYAAACRTVNEQYIHYVLWGGVGGVVLHQCICKCFLWGWMLAENELGSVSLKSSLSWFDHSKPQKIEVENKIQKMLSFRCLFFIFNYRSHAKIMAQYQQRRFRLDKMNNLFGPVFYNPSVDNMGQQEMLQGKTRNPRLSSYMVDNTSFIFLFTVIKFSSGKLFVCIFQNNQFFCLLVHLV